MGLHPAHKVGVDVGELMLLGIDDVADIAQHEQVALAEFAVSALGKLLGLVLESTSRMR